MEMSMRQLVIIALLVVAGCSPRIEQLQIPDSPNDTMAPSPNQLGENEKQLVGTYYRGNGTGYNLTLTLNSDGQFHCISTGCVGDYGTSTGTWRVDNDQIQMLTLTAKGTMEDRPIGALTVSMDSEKTILVQNNSREFFDAHGPSRYSCFQVTTPND